MATGEKNLSTDFSEEPYTDRMSDVLSPLLSVVSNFSEIEAVYIFGSTVKGTARKGSDIDLGVVVSPSHGGCRDLLINLQGALIAAGIDNADISLLNAAPPILRHQATVHGKLVYKKDSFDHPGYIAESVRLFDDIQYYLKPHREALKARLTHGTKGGPSEAT